MKAKVYVGSDVVATELAETLLLAMDGDFLPGAGMGIDNQGQDVPLDKARPKEVAWWAAEVVAAHLSAPRPRGLALLDDAIARLKELRP